MVVQICALFVESLEARPLSRLRVRHWSAGTGRSAVADG